MATMYNVKNRSAARTTYRIAEEGIYRAFAPGEIKQISDVELEKLTFQPGGMAILSQFLQILDPVMTQRTIGKVEPEYNMSERDIINLLTTGTIEEFLDCLDFAPRGIVDLIKQYSVSLPLSDYEKRNALKKKTGFDCDAALRHIKEESEEDNNNSNDSSTKERRVKTEAAAGRRTTPKYTTAAKEEAKTEE